MIHDFLKSPKTADDSAVLGFFYIQQKLKTLILCRLTSKHLPHVSLSPCMEIIP